MDKPKLCFFFDEHIALRRGEQGFPRLGPADGAADPLEGVGVYFITQTPKDVDGDVLSQLGNRVQHALRASPPTMPRPSMRP